jgi:hypothetical protein
VLQQEDADSEATFVYCSLRFIVGFEVGLRWREREKKEGGGG